MLPHSRTLRRASGLLICLALLALSACDLLPLGGGRQEPAPQIASAVTDVDGLARVDSAAGVIDFQVTSGLTGERLSGVKLSAAVFGSTRLLYAEDPTGVHLPLAVPLTGDATVRRLVMPPRTTFGYNICTAAAPLKLDDLTPLGTLSEDTLRARLGRSPKRAVLIYLYNPARPLALTGAPLEAYTTPIENVTVLRAGGEPPDATLGLLVVGMNKDAFDGWSHRVVDRYLAARVGQQPYADLSGDLTLGWAYPVFEVFPAEEALDLGAGEVVTLRVNWRSQNPDPPPPWQFFISADSDAVTAEPESFGLEPGVPPQEVTLTVDRSLLAEGEYSVTVFVQPFSEAFGLIEQGIERTLTFTVAEVPPTPTPGPSIDLAISPTDPHEGGKLTVTAEGFTPGEAVLLEFIGAERTISDGLATADDAGNFCYEIDLRNAPAGDYTLRLTGSQSGVTGSTTVTVGGRPPDAIVTSDELNLRTGPSYEYPVLEVLVTGDELQVIGTNNDDSWIEVITSTGVRGWVVTDLVELYIDLADVPWNPDVPSPP